MTKTKEQAPTVPTATLVDVFATIAKEHDWCTEAERYLELHLGLSFEPLNKESYCCSEHSADQRFRLTEKSPTTLDAERVANAVKTEVRRDNLSREDADRLLAVLPEEFWYPPKVTVKVSFTVEVDDLDQLTAKSTRGVQRYLGERLYGGKVQELDYSV